MKFKHIILFSVKDYNNNKEKNGYLPQDGIVINVTISGTSGISVVAVGYSK